METAVKMFLNRWLEAAYPNVTTGYQTGMVACIVVATACGVILLVDFVDQYGINWVVRHYWTILLLFLLSMIGVYGFGNADATASRDIRFRMMTRDDNMRRRYEQLETHLREETDFVKKRRFEGSLKDFGGDVENPEK